MAKGTRHEGRGRGEQAQTRLNKEQSSRILQQTEESNEEKRSETGRRDELREVGSGAHTKKNRSDKIKGAVRSHDERGKGTADH